MKDYELSIIKSQLEVIASKLRNASVSDAALVASSIEHVARVIVINPKPRTKTEFVKCEFKYAWEAVKEHEENKNIFHCNDGGEYAICGYDIHIIGGCVNDGEIYRKVETEIDERQEFIDSAVDLLNEKSHDHEANHYKEWFGGMFDSGKFKLVDGK